MSLPRSVAPVLGAAVGHTILVQSRNMVLFEARLLALEVHPDPTLCSIVLGQMKKFRSLVDMPDASGFSAVDTPFVRALSEAEVASILAQSGGFAEAPQTWEHSYFLPPSAAALHPQALAAYGHRCAVTGAAAQPDMPDLDVIAIVPVSAGGAQSLNNLLVLAPIASAAFVAGNLAIDADGYFVLRSSTPPELSARLNPTRRLLRPADIAAWPAPDYLASHYARAFGAPVLGRAQASLID